MPHKRLLAVWAHPDDEAFGPVGTLRLAHDLGWQTAIICATRGDAGVSDLADLRLCQTLGDLREAELRCACEQIGIDQLFLWNYPDAGLRDLPPGTLLNRILPIMRDWQPQIVITFGPDGITGHPDHIAISNAATEAFHQTRNEIHVDRPLRLYYVTIAPERRVEKRMGEAPPPNPTTTMIDVSKNANVKLAALRCHASQRGDWEPLLQNPEWTTIDRFYRAYPPAHGDDPIENTMFDA